MEVKAVGSVSVVALDARVDSLTSGDVQTTLTSVVDGGSRKIVCDFAQTEYVSSAGLRVLFATAKRLRQAGGEIVLASLRPYVAEVFEVAGLTRVIKIYDSLETALASIEKPAATN